MPLAVLRFPERGRDLRRALSPAMHAVPGEVELAADEPGRPLRPPREIHDPIPRLRELQSHVVDRGGPEPLRILGGPALQLAIVVDAELPHQAHDVCVLEHFRGRRPRNLHLAKKRKEEPCGSS